MGRIVVLGLGIALLLGKASWAQVGEHVSAVKVLNMQNQPVSLPWVGEKNLLIFYADPAHPRQNKGFRNYMKTHPINNPNVDSYGVINLAAAPMIPNGMIRRMALKEVRGTNAQLFMDPDHVLGTAWKLPGSDDNFAVIFVNKDGVIEFYKAGQMTQEEQQQVLDLIKKYEK